MFEIFTNLPKEIAVFLISMIPIGELRASIPIAINVYEMGNFETYFWAVFGNLVPVILIVLFIEKISDYLSHHVYFFNRFFTWLFEHTRKKHSRKFEIYEELFLILFVAIPLPITGGWSGALAAFVFGIPPKKAIPLIALGLMIAGGIVMMITRGVNFVI